MNEKGTASKLQMDIAKTARELEKALEQDAKTRLKAVFNMSPH
jgi:hypothetical protein